MILIFFRLHLEDVGDDAVNLNVPNEAGEEEILHSLRVEGPQGGEEEEESGEPVPVSWVGLAGPVLQLRHGLVLQALHCVVICKTKCLLLLLFVIFNLATRGGNFAIKITNQSLAPDSR